MGDKSTLDVLDTRSARRRTVLVVEDHRDHLEAVRDTLEEEGYRVTTAGHGREALERVLAGAHPDLIVLDLKMPVMNGWAFMAELKARPELSAIPVVVMSGAGDAVLSSAPVAAGYLAKPLDRSRLLETVANCLSRLEQRQSGTRRREGG